MADAQENFNGFTYGDYAKWDSEDGVYELVHGCPYMISSPDLRHQDTVGKIYRQLADFLDGKPCKVIISPFDVRLFPKDDDSDNVVYLPDLMVVCDKSKLADGKSCKGSPDFVIEVTSRTTRKMDIDYKRRDYEKAGVKEYWVVERDKLHVYRLDENSRYVEIIHPLKEGFTIAVSILPDCVIKF
jgi:Uma2 family endonuclease